MLYDPLSHRKILFPAFIVALRLEFDLTIVVFDGDLLLAPELEEAPATPVDEITMGTLQGGFGLVGGHYAFHISDEKLHFFRRDFVVVDTAQFVTLG